MNQGTQIWVQIPALLPSGNETARISQTFCAYIFQSVKSGGNGTPFIEWLPGLNDQICWL